MTSQQQQRPTDAGDGAPLIGAVVEYAGYGWRVVGVDETHLGTHLRLSRSQPCICGSNRQVTTEISGILPSAVRLVDYTKAQP